MAGSWSHPPRQARPPRWELADIFRLHGPAYRRTHALPASHRRVMADIEACRTAALGGHLERCDACGFEQPSYNSCGNRHCPKCQALAKARWLEARRADLLPVGYFHTVFTLPHRLNPLILTNKKALFDLLFHAAAQTLSEVFRGKFMASLNKAFAAGHRRFLLHVLPERYTRIRHFGFLANASKGRRLPQCRPLLSLAPEPPARTHKTARQLVLQLTGIDIALCPRCRRGTLRPVARLEPVPFLAGILLSHKPSLQDTS